MNKKCSSPQVVHIAARKANMSADYWNKCKCSCNICISAFSSQYVQPHKQNLHLAVSQHFKLPTSQIQQLTLHSSQNQYLLIFVNYTTFTYLLKQEFRVFSDFCLFSIISTSNPSANPDQIKFRTFNSNGYCSSPSHRHTLPGPLYETLYCSLLSLLSHFSVFPKTAKSNV